MTSGKYIYRRAWNKIAATGKLVFNKKINR